MRRVFLFCFLVLAGLANPGAKAGPLDEYTWVNRVIVVFADSALDPRFTQQMTMLAEDPESLENRDMVVITDLEPGSELRTRLRPRGFSIVLIDKDDSVILRRPSPLSVREIARHIDKTPSRIDELAAGAPR
tara:strand:- start:128 stop:523 length:396 start_codon:yes stop_codon:yes gene_type:complete